MGIKGLMTYLGMETFGLVALVICFAAFVSIVVRVVLKPQREVDRQARLPLAPDDEN